MEKFNYQIFLNIKNFKHKDLWKEDFLIWNVLKLLDSYLKKQDLGKIETDKISPQAYLINPEQISIGKGTIIEPGAYIKGPCLIGEDCIIRHGAYIRGNLITGNNCLIGHATEVKNSIFLDNVSAAHFAYVGDSILGNEVNLGAGVKCANFRLDKKEISFLFKGQKIKTGLDKLGAIIGDRVSIGCNTVLNPATFLGKGSFCYPCLNVFGFIEEKSIIKSSSLPLIKKSRVK